MNGPKTHKDLDVWKKSLNFAEEVYSLTKDFPREEKFGLTSQIRRAVISIPSNIAEGASRNTTKEFIQFLYYAVGSISEVEAQLILSHRLGFIVSNEGIFSDLEEIKRMLLGLIKSLRKTTH